MTPPPALASHQHAPTCWRLRRILLSTRSCTTAEGLHLWRSTCNKSCYIVSMSTCEEECGAGSGTAPAVSHGGWGGTESSNASTASALLIEDSAHVNTQTSGQEKTKKKKKKITSRSRGEGSDCHARQAPELVPASVKTNIIFILLPLLFLVPTKCSSADDSSAGHAHIQSTRIAS